MKLLNAHFINFRLLRNLTIDFSVDPAKPLTVIRAENESGKTTLLTALQWALYGDGALPTGGENYRIHPIDWDASVSTQVPITVTIEYEVTSLIPNPSGAPRTHRDRYRLIRTTNEQITGTNWKRGRSAVQLFHLTDRGDTPLQDPEARIVEQLPPELREVFFTDGDRALSFIEAGLSMSTKRDRVARAIRALLGLSVIEAAQKHVREASADINRKTRGMTASADLKQISHEIENNETLIDQTQTKLSEAIDRFDNLDEQLNDIDKHISIALQKGDQEVLARDLANCKTSIKTLDDQLEAQDRAHSGLFRSASLARDLLGPQLQVAMTIMDTMSKQGKLPKTAIAVLEERLDLGECICGSTLVAGDDEGMKRRQFIQATIEKSKKDDDVQKTLTEFYYRSKSFVYDDSRENRPWVESYADYFKQRSYVESQREAEGTRLRSIETQISQLGRSDIVELRENQKLYRQQRDEATRNVAILETQQKSAIRSLDDLQRRRDSLLKEESKGKLISGQLLAVQDLELVLKRSYERISKDELRKVSDEMNNLFLKMIGADPDQNAIIRRAVISEDYDIVVYGTEERRLNPDQDLNGASRRALTISFILALTKVSEVEAPNVIDTPLGMMSGFVKREVLRTAIKESSQLILLLTGDEISNCENIIDESAGKVFTLTNPAHYPKILVNEPPSGPTQILRCECTHRGHCKVCDRRLDELQVAV